MSEDIPAYPGPFNLPRFTTQAATLIEIAHPGKPTRWYHHHHVGLRLWAAPLPYAGLWRVLSGQGYDGCHVGINDAQAVREGWVRMRLEEVAGPDGQYATPLDGRLS